MHSSTSVKTVRHSSSQRRVTAACIALMALLNVLPFRQEKSAVKKVFGTKVRESAKQGS